MRFIPIYGRQAFKIDGKFKFWGGLTVEAVGGGPGLINMLTESAKKRGIEIRYHTRALDLLYDGDRVEGVRVRHDGQVSEIQRASRSCSPAAASRPIRNGAPAISAPAGTSPRCAARASTPATASAWRSTSAPARAATGRAATRCSWEMNAPEFGDLAVGDQFQKHSYPFAILINATGKRFVDEGADFRNYTYAKYGRVVLEQPGQFAWQIFDQKVKHLQRDEYRIRQITKVTANTIEELAQKLEGVNAEQFVKTIAEWNKAVRTDVPFNPERQGRPPHARASPSTRATGRTRSTRRRYEGYAVTCGITFTFGGLRINTDGEVLNTDYQPIRGLYAAGELVGGLFYFNYPGGSGLCAGAVFGKIAGTSAGRRTQTGEQSQRGREQRAPQRTLRHRDRARHRRRRDHRGGGRARLPRRASRRASRPCRRGPPSTPSMRSRRRARSIAGRTRGALHGVPIGVKDVIDTVRPADRDGLADLQGPPRGLRRRLRRARARGRRGDPRQDRHLPSSPACSRARPPIRTIRAHTPGGSSSGSAAAVADHHGAGGVRHADRRLGAAPGRLLRRRRLQADVQPDQSLGHQIRRRDASTPSGCIARTIDDVELVTAVWSSARPGAAHDGRQRLGSALPHAALGHRAAGDQARGRGRRQAARGRRRRRCARSCCRRNSRALYRSRRARPSTITSARSRMAADWASDSERISKVLGDRVELGIAMRHDGLRRGAAARPRIAAREIERAFDGVDAMIVALRQRRGAARPRSDRRSRVPAVLDGALRAVDVAADASGAQEACRSASSLCRAAIRG